MNKMLASEKEKSQQSLHNLTVAKESEISKSQAEVGLIRHQVEITGKKNKLLEQELSSLEKRIEAKNDYITKLEEQKCTLSDKIARL